MSSLFWFGLVFGTSSLALDASLASASPKLASLVDENRESPFDGMFVGNVKIPNHSPALRSQQAY
jgi:hypothetical protein